MAIDGDSPTVNAKAAAFVEKSILAVPFVSFVCEVDPMHMTIYSWVDALLKPGEEVPTKVLASAGVFTTDGFQVRSDQDINLHLPGTFEVTDDHNFAKLVRSSIRDPKLSVLTKGKMDTRCRIWGWLPWSISGVDIQYGVDLPALDNFREHGIQLDEIEGAEGEAGALKLTCAVKIFNPMPLSMYMSDVVELDVMYKHFGAMFRIGRIQIPKMNLTQGENFPTGIFTIEQTADNVDAVKAVATAYVGGVMEGFGPAGMHPFSVTVRDAGKATATSPILLAALMGLNLTVDFRPKPIYLVQRITADVVVGGSIIHWPPALYKATCYVVIRNPLPQEVRVNSLNVLVMNQNISGPLLYKYMRTLVPADYVLGPMSDTTLGFDLSITEIVWPTFKSIAEVLGTHRLTVGVDVNIDLTIMPGYRQTVNYQNSAIYGEICIHATMPTEKCGLVESSGLPAALRAPAMISI